jgi:Protein of unknown function (DUF3455)
MNGRTLAARIGTTRFIVAAIVAAALAGAAAHGAPAKTGLSVPAKIAVPAGNKLFLTAHATGVQIYSCSPAASGYAWSFVAPRASLYDRRGKLLTTHFAGPTWQAKDGSSVVGRVVDRVTPYPTAIPWLLLSAASTTVGDSGDRLARTTYIQRLNTSGGLAPDAGCSAERAGAVARVPYSADYAFWKAAGV